MLRVPGPLRAALRARLPPTPNRRGEDADDEDQKVLALNFRDKVERAVGHNTSLMAPVIDAEGRVHRLETTQLPEHEVLRVDHVRFDDVLTRMSSLARLDGEGLERGLSPLVEAYRSRSAEAT